MRLLIGLMSGTSMDGIDAALVDVDTQHLLGALTRPYGQECRLFLEEILKHEQVSPGTLSQLNTLLGREFAKAAQDVLIKTAHDPKDIIAIGSHGQTLCHDATAPIPYTIQLGCAHTIAELTGICVVADFRTRDLVLDGQGAPFAPLYHQALFGALERPMAVLNIGGIANVTYLHDGLNGHDVGPGNCLMDAWTQKHCGQGYDAGGEWAATGGVILPLLEALLADPYFQAPTPKSLGKEYFSKTWLTRHLQGGYAPKDVQATLLALTARTVADDLKKFPIPLKRLVLCGGGAHNKRLLHVLKQECPGLLIETSASYGIDPDYVEAMMFAWFADQALNGVSLDFTGITGSRRSAVYGAIYPK
ncbi:MAG: anhydro-N-acetylmuramic acid kinase [Legionellales bacterium]|nr:anhydro-N-acetylmuramic acid kinase [Legionellales bacterium]